MYTISVRQIYGAAVQIDPRKIEQTNFPADQIKSTIIHVHHDDERQPDNPL